jgi:hypothetical protein
MRYTVILQKEEDGATLLPSPFFPAAFRRETLDKKLCEILRKQSNCMSRICEPLVNRFQWRTREPMLRSILSFDDRFPPTSRAGNSFES